MVAPVLRESAFVWLCVVFAGGCLAVAVAVRARHFLHELSEQFISLPPSGKAVIAAAVVVATVFAQKPTSASTNQSESAEIEANLSEVSATLNTEDEEDRRHGEGEEWWATNQHESARIEICEDPCQSVDKNSSELRASVSPCETIVSSNDVVRGYRLETVRTNATDFSVRPANARLVGTWHLTDAYRGRAWVLLGEEGKGKREKGRSADGQLLPSSLFLFPLGPHVVTSLWAHTWGKVRPQLRNASNEIFVIGAPMFARHDQSYLWTAATTNGSVLLTWENFFLGNPYERGVATDSHGLALIGDEKPTALNTEGSEGRRHGEGWKVLNRRDKSDRIVAYGPPRSSNPVNPVKETPCLPASNTSVFSAAGTSTFSESNPLVVHPPITAQLELFPNGDFIARSNDVERVYRRVNPDDWDDDGIPNGADDAPLIPSDTPQFGPHQDLSGIAHSNNYYWVDLVVPTANALVTFTGSGASSLPDPSFVAKAGETNRVVLLLGKPYTAKCRLPLVCVGTSHPDVAVGEDRNGHLTICRPVRCEIVDDSPIAAFRASAVTSHAASGGRRLRFTPDPDGFDVTWNGNYCCLEPPPPPFTVPLFNCNGNCGCGGCAVGTYTCRFEGFELSFPNWPCGCSHESPPDESTHPGEDEPDAEPQGPHVSARFSESAIIFEDEYENAPGETVARRSTVSEAAFSVYGGTKGGTYSFELRDGGRLERVGGSFLPREGKLEPGESFKIKVKYMARSASGNVGDIKAVATFTEEESEEKITSEATLTAVKVTIRPAQIESGNGSEGRHKFGVYELIDCGFEPEAANVSWNVKGGGKMQKDKTYRCPLDAESNPLEVVCAGASYTPSIRVVEPSGVRALNPSAVTYGLSSLSAGGIGLQLDIQVLPLDVSFQEIWIEEVPSTMGVQTGYFTHPYFDGDRCHSRENGAGVWFSVLDENIIDARDTAAYTQPYPRMTPSGQLSESLSEGWIAGENVWSIPLGWNVPQTPDGAEPWKCFAADETQTFTIDAFGTAGVRKLRHEAVREVLGSVYLDGVKLW